jgi:hypothetical protein
MARDKNIAALLNEKAYTVGVQFQHSLGKEFAEYTFVTDLPVARISHTSEKVDDALVITPTMHPGIAIGGLVLVPTKMRKGSQYDNEKVDSTMLLEAGIRMSVAVITRVDQEVVIQPDDNTEYSWVISSLAVDNYWLTKQRNAEVVALVQEAYTKNLRRTFAQQILSGLSDETASRIKLLLSSQG